MQLLAREECQFMARIKKTYLASIYKGFGCLNVQINDKSLNAEFYTDNGKTIDHFTIVKNLELDSGNVFHHVGYDSPSRVTYYIRNMTQVRGK